MAVGRDFLIKQVEGNPDWKYFSILGADRKSIIISQDNANLQHAQVIEMINDFCDSFEGIAVFRFMSGSKQDLGKGGNVKPLFEMPVRCGSVQRSHTGMSGFTGMQPVSGISQREVDILKESHAKEIQAIHDKYGTEKKFEDLKREMKELKGSGINGLVEQFAPVLMQWFAGQQKMPTVGVGVAGAQSMPTDQERILAAAQRMGRVDPDYIETIELLAEYAERSPADFLAFKPVLKNAFNPVENG